jgi:transcriptional regulatory protein LEU3
MNQPGAAPGLSAPQTQRPFAIAPATAAAVAAGVGGGAEGTAIHVPPTHIPSGSGSGAALLSSAAATWTAREYAGAQDGGASHSSSGVNGSQKRKACNECRQQKLRCDLSQNLSLDGLRERGPKRCSRCNKLDLECKVDDTFQRTRKRKRSQEFVEEIKDLRRQLAAYEREYGRRSEGSSGVRWKGDYGAEESASGRGGDETPDRAAPGRLSSGSPSAHRASVGHAQRTPSLVNNGLLPVVVADADVLRSPETNGTEVIAGNATRPHEHELEAPSQAEETPVSRPRSLGHGAVTLDEIEIEELFSIFLADYHKTLPILDPGVPAQQYAELSPLLFWTIMAVASRRSQSATMLLSKLSQPVTDLLWTAIRSVPHSLALVQSILLLCAWPFPTSSSATDPSYVLVHTAVAASIQIGLHRPQHPQDFAKYKVRLTEKEVALRAAVWTACNVIAER